MKEVLGRILPMHLIKRAGVHFSDFKSSPPVLVYQMGKVASSTVYDTLRTSGRFPNTYHIHFLDPKNMAEISRHYRETGNHWTDKRLSVNRAIYDKSFACLEKGSPVHIITLVRDPVARDISDVFQNLATSHAHLLREDGSLSVERAISHIQAMFENYDYASDYACTWFERELKSAFGIDLFRYDFDHEAGYSIIREGALNVLAIRAEDLNEKLMPALDALFGGDFFRGRAVIRESNIGSQKDYAADYREVCKRLRLPQSVCEHIYASPLATHFYSAAERQAFIEKWSRKTE